MLRIVQAILRKRQHSNILVESTTSCKKTAGNRGDQLTNTRLLYCSNNRQLCFEILCGRLGCDTFAKGAVDSVRRKWMKQKQTLMHHIEYYLWRIRQRNQVKKLALALSSKSCQQQVIPTKGGSNYYVRFVGVMTGLIFNYI